MALYFLCSILIIFIYLLLIGWTANGWDRVEETRLSNEYQAQNTYTVLIPFKDEEASIGDCLQSLLNQEGDSPIMEIIAINDHSEDNGPTIAANFPVTLIHSSEKGKKAALSKAISLAKNEYIITVDADCTFHKQWLKLIDQSIQSNEADILVGPVVIKEEDSILSRFQFMDTASTMAVTAAGLINDKFYLSNGANFIYKKSAFLSVHGFKGNDQIASGDDVFLMGKFKEEGFTIAYCKSRRASAITKGENSIHHFINQRQRWASKSKAYANRSILFFQGYIFFTAASLIFTLFILPFFIGSFALITGGFMLFLKMIIDYLYLNKMIRFFKGKKVMKSFLICSLLYLPYICFMAYIALFPSTTDWKGRTV